MFYFEKLPVYMLTEECYILIVKYCLKNQAINAEFRSQLQRSGSSILLNISEGMGKFNKKDKRKFYAIARGSVHESVSVVKILYLEGHIMSATFHEIYTKLDIIARMLSALIRAMSEK
ncbi:MAG: four helix bundle protein [Candidatus Abawacabacteria bacterium]|nr:four helix bundle protein [Candidatus Abawacabacteria bacterium]